MTKSISTMGRKDGSTREAFQAYYESNHAVLGAKYFPFTKYVRNHLIDHDGLWYDTISEFWADDIEQAANLMNGPVGEILREDENKFCSQQAIGPAFSEEHILSQGVPTDKDGNRAAALIARDGISEEDFKTTLLRVARSAAVHQSGVSVDLCTSWRDIKFPADAVLWTPEIYRAPLPKGLKLNMTLRVRRIETPAEKLSINQK